DEGSLEFVQRGTHGVVIEAIVGAVAFASDIDEAQVAQHLEVAARRRLTDADLPRQVTDRHREAAQARDQCKQQQARGVAERLEAPRAVTQYALLLLE